MAGLKGPEFTFQFSKRTLPCLLLNEMQSSMDQGVPLEQPTDDGSLGVQIAVRLAGTGYLLAFLTALAFAPIGYFLFGSAEFALLSIGFSVAYLLLPIASKSLPQSATRLVFIFLITLHYALALLCVGPYAGLEAFTICLAALPLLLFAKTERRLLWVAYGTITVGVALAEILSMWRPPLLALEQSVRASAYIASIGTVAVVMTYLLFSYSRSSIANCIKLQKERVKSEEMLRELVPADVAQHLLNGESVPAQSHGECTVLFADLVHFTDLAENLSPVHLVELLNGIFSDIDGLQSQWHRKNQNHWRLLHVRDGDLPAAEPHRRDCRDGHRDRRCRQLLVREDRLSPVGQDWHLHRAGDFRSHRKEASAL
ncbi:hypothetical protein SFHh103_09010 (plasmid) [Sinorhizobium fredii HH103]|uniref:Guanylate cyclase domain-containing protein n=1 Tax=Sinorhizobium fredii (strain HH103) TaxID=1117943 RepID=A0A0B7MJJ8_SINF1|nr:hypothetical protein SFHh103_09010 [Sinorhizobium fredii HH103]